MKTTYSAYQKNIFMLNPIYNFINIRREKKKFPVRCGAVGVMTHVIKKDFRMLRCILVTGSLSIQFRPHKRS